MPPIVDVTDATFETEVLHSKVPVMLDLWAEWCEPCKTLAHAVGAIAGDYQGRMKICRMDVARNPRIPSQYHVKSLPTVLFIRAGRVVGQHVGSARAADLSAKIEGHLGIAAS
jgi:thioredoxin 1